MNFTFSQYRLSDLKIQRNALTGLCGVLLITNILQSAGLFYRQERVIITPPQLTQGFWVEGNQFSPHYLQEMALHYAHLLLDVTEKSVLSQGEILLHYVVPESYGVFKAKLLEDEKYLKKNQLSTRFYPMDIKVSPENLSVEMTGDFMGYVGDKRISKGRETYQVRFQNRSGRLLLEDFRLLNSDRSLQEEGTE